MCLCKLQDTQFSTFFQKSGTFWYWNLVQKSGSFWYWFFTWGISHCTVPIPLSSGSSCLPFFCWGNSPEIFVDDTDPNTTTWYGFVKRVPPILTSGASSSHSTCVQLCPVMARMRASVIACSRCASWSSISCRKFSESMSSSILNQRWMLHRTKQTLLILSPVPPIFQLYSWCTARDRTWSLALHPIAWCW